MNERAIDLYKQAANYAYSTIEKEFWDTEAFKGVIVGKFAELIVEECAEAVKNSIWHLPRGYKAEDQAEFVKKHFGVE